MKKTVSLYIAGSVALAFLAGCESPPGPYTPQDTTKYTVESTEKFEVIDRPAQISVTCTGLQEWRTAEGRLEVAANIKNRENRRVQVQIDCVFKDDQGFSTEVETPWQSLTLGENATEVVRYTATNSRAQKYTIRVRQAR